MAHIIENLATVISNTGDVYSNVYVIHAPIITPEIIKTGEIPIKLFFFKNKETMENGFRNFIPIINGKEVYQIIKKVTKEELEELLPLKISQFVHQYLSDIFGFWNIHDEQYGSTEVQLNITEDFIIELSEFKKIIGIKITNNSTEEFSENGNYIISLHEDVGDSLVFSTSLLPQQSFEFKELLKRTNYTTFLLKSSDWSKTPLTIKIKREEKINIEL
ncbi:MAG: hypothetical protein SNJ71_00200 [Bacteroidales bacterium]